MKKDKAGSNEFVLAAYDEHGNLILAAQGNEVLARNVARLANMEGGVFQLKGEASALRMVIGFHRSRVPPLQYAKLVDALNMLKGWIANDDEVNARLHEELTSRGIVPCQDTVKDFLIGAANDALKVQL